MLKKISLLLALAFGGTAAFAEEQARWFRYYDERGQASVTDYVTPDHVSHGYEELTAGMQVIRRIPAQKPLTAAELAEAKAKRDKELQNAQQDKLIRRMYSGPQDAERMRNRKLDGIQARIDSNASALANLRKRRAEEGQRAANFERTGKPVPADIKENIAAFDRQAQAKQKEIDSLKSEQEKVRAEFDPIIRRLEVLTGKPASSSAAAPATSAPAAAPAAAAPAPVPKAR